MQVAKLVYEFLGGEVQHTYPDGGEGPAEEEARMLRRLKAMTLMQQEGWMPQVQFWQEPGTLLDGLQLVRRVTVGALRIVFTCVLHIPVSGVASWLPCTGSRRWEHP